MGDAQYWGSLGILILFILLSLAAIIFGAQVLTFFYERISVWPLWNSPVWIKLKVPLIIIGVICFIAGVLAFSRHQDKKELQAARDYAQAQGWGFSRDAAPELKTRAEAILANLYFTMKYISTIETGQRSLYLFNCTYKNRSSSGRKNYSYGIACLVESKRFRSAVVPVEIVARDWTEMMNSDRVDMGNSPFAQDFLVLSKDPGAAKEIVNDAVQATILEHSKKPSYNPVSITIGSGGAVVLTASTAAPEQLQEIIDLVRRIEAAVEPPQ
jgi:hypothetical protein